MSVRFEDTSDGIRKEIEERKKRALTEAAIQLEGEIAIRTPVDTGHLRASISHIAPWSSGHYDGERCYKGKPGTKVHKGQKKPGYCREDEHPGTLQGMKDENAAYVGTNVEYAAYVEYGTRYQKAQPYMRTGFAAAKRDIDRIIRGRLNLGD